MNRRRPFSVLLAMDAANVSNAGLLPLPSSSGNLSAAASTRHVTVTMQSFISVFYLFGISGNVCSLVTLAQNETPRNKKQTLMLRCLAYNDLFALLGSTILMYLQLYTPAPFVRSHSHGFCVCRVFLRVFGFGSGSVAIVMAVERWLALTRPFVYQQYITSKLIIRFIFALWGLAAFLVCLPFIGFGLYYDVTKPQHQRCVRYRYGTSSKDIAYAYVIFTFGMLLSICIVCCNVLVIRMLCRMGERNMARITRTVTRKETGEVNGNQISPEEMSFARLMAVLCIFFVICWLPQMITIVAAQIDPAKKDRHVYRLADICIALNFALDPYIYVLLRRPHRHFFICLMKSFRCIGGGNKEISSTNTSRPSSLRESDGTKSTKSGRETPCKELIAIVVFKKSLSDVSGYS